MRLYIAATPRPILLCSNTIMSITTYQFSGNQSSVNVNGDNINYNIAIRVHLGKYSGSSYSYVKMNK